MTVQAAPFRHSPKDVSVALAIEVDGERLEFLPTPSPDARSANDSVFANNIELAFFGINQAWAGPTMPRALN